MMNNLFEVNECLWIWWEVASIDKESPNLDVNKLGVVIESFKIVLNYLKLILQPSTIQFNLHVPFMYCCRFVWINVNLSQNTNTLIKGIIYKQYKLSS